MGVLEELGAAVRQEFTDRKDVLSFDEYLEVVEGNPALQLRSAAQYVRDALAHFGCDSDGRYRLFDAKWDGGVPLVGQQEAQARVFQILDNFVREGAVNKLIVLHGPNGSAKSTFVRTIGRGLHEYSKSDVGAMYGISWVFPTDRNSRKGIGFEGDAPVEGSHAHLPPELIQAKLFDEFRDHPLLFIPVAARRKLLDKWAYGKSAEVPDYLKYGRLSQKNFKIYDALLRSYKGDYLAVLNHVQVERFYIDHRYRHSDVTVEPQLSVDASERQVTMDRSTQALPSSLQYLSLHEYGGALVDGNRGLIEYSDLLKRPLEAYKYLLTTVEKASVSMGSATLFLDLVFMATTNEVHLHAFKQVPDFQSFRGRIELVRLPYLLNYREEEKLYRAKLKEAAAGKHLAPHCALVASLWAVLSRLRKPDPSAYPAELREIVANLSPLEKARLFAKEGPPPGLSAAEGKMVTASLPQLKSEHQARPDYEGVLGASPRAMMQVIYDAAGKNAGFVSPAAILEEISNLCEKRSVYDFLSLEPDSGYSDFAALIEVVKEVWLDAADSEFCEALGFVDAGEYDRLFDNYILHVIHWTKKERIRNPRTGDFEHADEGMMRGVEETLEAGEAVEEFRHALISRIGAWSLDNPNEKPLYPVIFPKHFEKIRHAYYLKQRIPVKDGVEAVLKHLDGAADADAAAAIERLIKQFGYSDESVKETASLLLGRYKRLLAS